MIQNETQKTISTRQQKAILALLQCSSVSDAAKSAGVGRATLARWLNDEAFKFELKKAESSLVSSATRRLCSLTEKATGTLESVLDSEDATDSTRVRAALGVLDAMIKLRSFSELEERITRLEEIAERDQMMNTTIAGRLKSLEKERRLRKKDRLMILTCLPDEDWYPGCGIMKLEEAGEMRRKAILKGEVDEENVIIIVPAGAEDLEQDR